MKKIICMGMYSLLFGFVMCVGQLSADIVVNEDFSHADGALVGQTPTPGPGAAWAAHSGAGNKAIQVSGGAISLEQSTGSGEDANSGFSAFGATDTIYARFDFSLASGQTVDPDSSGLYFASFREGFNLRGRTGIVVPSGAGDFGLAINADNSNLGAGATWASDLSFDTDYRVVISWNAATGESLLWLDPTTMGDTSISHTGTNTGDLMDSFAFRQSNDYTGSQTIDNLVVATNFGQALSGVPEPGSVMFLMLGGIGLVCRRRR